MKKFLLLTFMVFLMAGCAEETTTGNGTTSGGQTTTDNGITSGGQTSPEQQAKVDEAFANEYKKYVTDNSGEFSTNSITNIKSLLQNITGRGGMPAQAGIGEINETVVASSFAKNMAESLIKATTEPNAQALVKYATLDTDSKTFMSAVLGGFMGGETGKKILETGKLYQANQKAIAMLVASHTALFEKANQKVESSGTTNLAYLYSSLTGYFGMLEITALPTDEASVNKIAQAVYDHCKDVDSQTANNLAVYNKDTTTFTVMPILTCGKSSGGMPSGEAMTYLISFMNGVGKAINPNYEFSMGGRP